MPESYTRQSINYIMALPDLDTAVIWENIGSTPLDTTQTLWRKKLQKIADEHAFSSRYALMRILCSRALKTSVVGPDDTEVPAVVDGFEYETYHFRNISREHAENLTPQEHQDYIACLMSIASTRADSDPSEDLRVISRAWFDVEGANAVAESRLPKEITSNKKLLKQALSDISKENKASYKEQLTREEALHLGHILNFSLEEAQWYLLRVLYVENGLLFNDPGDLIEAYGFLTGASWKRVKGLHTTYAKRSKGIEKRERADPHNEWTRNIAGTLPGKVEEWKRDESTMDGKFMAWLLEQTPELGAASRTTLRIYRNLASFAHDLITDVQYAPSDLDFADCIRDVYTQKRESGSAQRLLYKDGKISPARCKEVAGALLFENRIQSASIKADSAKAWHIPTQLSDGRLSAAGGIVNSSRTRVADILAGCIQPEKGDVLYLLWFISNFIWEQAGPFTDEVRSIRLMDFMELGADVLEEAMLPTFYPPHILEQSMLLSIVCGGKVDEDDPSVVYEYMLQSTVKARARKEKSDEDIS